MEIKEIRLSFIQLETLVAPLTSLLAPAIPYKFLLSEPMYQTEIAQIQAGGGPHHLPWHDGHGKLFWFYYLEKKGPSVAKPKDVWRGLVPLECDIDGKASSPGIPGSVALRGYLHPWGIGVIVDVEAKGSWSLEQAVDFAFHVRNGNDYVWTANVDGKPLSLNAVIGQAIAGIRAKAYGPAMAAGQTGDAFSLVTVLDADGVDPAAPVKNKKELHRALEACANWSQYWKESELKNLSDRTIEIKTGPPSHLLYGTRRGRVVWFPKAFRGTTSKPESLRCYHQNLMAATLQTESLCRLVQAIAKQLAAGQTVGQFSVTHGNCMRLAAGILGRLYGGSLETYRSHSVRDQIKQTYVGALNAVRGAVGMPGLG